jgi:YidC/Oxa1 family membrane protein insertase
MGQQFYVIRRNPTPGSVAYDALEKRRAAKAEKKEDVPKEKQGGVPGPSSPANGGEPITVATGGAGSGGAGSGTDGAGPDAPARRPARNQPQRASRSQRSGKKKRKR